MCGITCLVSEDINISDKIKSMTDIIYHRGPNSSNVWSSRQDNVALGHKRLSIIDISNNANQPMSSSQKKQATIVFNGEIYNFKEIKAELLELGYTFNSTGDTEVLLNGYIEWGEDIVHKLNGMWAFVIFDQSEKKLFISRDRVGMKPLYVYRENKTLIISSEIKSILKSGLARHEIDKDGLVEYFCFQNILSNKTLFKNIEYIPAGYNAIYDLRTNKYSQYEYWDFDFKEPSNSASIDQLSEEFTSIFTKSLDRHLIADVDIGVTLSGGMDSSAIVALASKQIKNLNSFTGFFDTRFIDKEDRCHSEHEDARVIAKEFGTIHHERLISASDVICTLPNIVWHMEDPKVAMSYTFYTMAQMVSQKVTVNLSGTGGDELFGGYPWRYNLIDKLTDKTEFNEVYYNYWCRLIGDDKRSNFFTQKVKREVDLLRPKGEFLAIANKKSDSPIIDQAFYFELKTFLLGMLMVEDKMGMAFSVETRFPFLDKEMLDFAGRVPSSMKYQNNEAKLLLKNAMRSILPEETIYKRKQGFTPPDRTWYKHELNYYISNLLLGKKSCIHEFISKAEIANILDRHNSGIADERMLIWSLIFFEGWIRVFLQDDTLANVPF